MKEPDVDLLIEHLNIAKDRPLTTLTNPFYSLSDDIAVSIKTTLVTNFSVEFDIIFFMRKENGDIKRATYEEVIEAVPEYEREVLIFNLDLFK